MPDSYEDLHLTAHTYEVPVYVRNPSGSSVPLQLYLLYKSGLLFRRSHVRWPGSHLPEYRVLLTTGLCGGFTTFSTFSNDGVILLKQGLYGLFFTYFILSITLGVVAAIVGGVIGGK
mgnify:CR=1 FL=1